MHLLSWFTFRRVVTKNHPANTLRFSGYENDEQAQRQERYIFIDLISRHIYLLVYILYPQVFFCDGNFGNFFKHARPSYRAWQGKAYLSIQNYYKKTVGNLCKIPFALSRQWFKIILGILSSMSVVGPPRKAWQGNAYFSLQNFSIILLASRSYSNNFSSSNYFPNLPYFLRYFHIILILVEC